MKKDQPDKRQRPELPKDPFGDFQYRQALAEEMLPMICLLYTSPSPRDKSQSRMPSSA